MRDRISKLSARDREAFRALNEAWIEKHFQLEEKDLETLGDPDRHILAKGGYILMAERGAELIGTCALIALGDGRFEIAKMTVAEQERGQGVGRELLKFAIEFAREKAIPRLYLETNIKLQSAIRIYEAVGFRHLRGEQLKPSPYTRVNVFMEMSLF